MLCLFSSYPRLLIELVIICCILYILAIMLGELGFYLGPLFWEMVTLLKLCIRTFKGWYSTGSIIPTAFALLVCAGGLLVLLGSHYLLLMLPEDMEEMFPDKISKCLMVGLPWLCPWGWPDVSEQRGNPRCGHKEAFQSQPPAVAGSPHTYAGVYGVYLRRRGVSGLPIGAVCSH